MSRPSLIAGVLAGAAMALGAGAEALEFSQVAAPPLTQGVPSRGDSSPVYSVPLYKSTIVPLRRAAKRVSVGNPGVADILVIRGDELYVVGKALGSTNVVVWGDDSRVFSSFDVEVTHDIETLKAKLFQLLPGENIQVHSAQERLILSGQVSSAARMDAARELAGGFLPDCIEAESDAPTRPVAGSATGRSGGGSDAACKNASVVNLMQVGGANQVMLKVTVAEVASTVVKKLDSNLNLLKFGARDGKLSGGAVNGGAAFPEATAVGSGALFPIFDGVAHPVGPPQQFFSPNTPTIDGAGAFLSYLEGNLFVQAVLDVSRRNGLAKILSEPTLTTLTGQEAKFLSGGEFPVPVPRGLSGNVTVEFKEFGVGLRFVPQVLDSGRINLDLKVSVSEISTDNAIALSGGSSSTVFTIPSLTTRSASSVVELADGQTIGIAGLISDNVREFVDKFPGLGDIPILGMLFRSQGYQSGQTELVIFVTPRLARPISAQQVRLPTDTFVPASDFSFYILGQMSRVKERENQDSGSEPASSTRREDLPQGSFGHQVSSN